MRIESIYLKDVGPFDELRVDIPAGRLSNVADVCLLTGENGSGKSTILYAIARILAANMSEMGFDFVSRRFTSPKSIAAVRFGDGVHALARVPENNEPVSNPFASNEILDKQILWKTDCRFYYDSRTKRNAGTQSIKEFRENSKTNEGDVPTTPVGWAAFAYAGMRSVGESSVSTISPEITQNPFTNCLSFSATSDSQLFSHWIASQDYRRLKAQDRGDQAGAQLARYSINVIGQTISRIIGESFGVEVSPDGKFVLAKSRGAEVSLDLLPEGLKSILSWVADLLMRLDRISWKNPSSPPTYQPFLLLLDEIDVHLHPKWQRHVLPLIQELFPNAQIIATTHSPFVVASASDAHIVNLEITEGRSRKGHESSGEQGSSYSAILQSIFGIDSAFDAETERLFELARSEIKSLLSGQSQGKSRLDAVVASISARSQEARELIAVELRQFERSMLRKSGP